MKQTAVEWLLENLISEPHFEKDFNYNSRCWDQAKEMEEKNLKDSFVAGAGVGEMFNNENRCYVSDAEQYLKETFKSK